MSFLFVLLFTGVVSATHQLSDVDGAKAKDSSSLMGSRLDKVERLLLEQDAKLTNQESLLRQQSAKLTSQDSLLRQQSAKLTNQEGLLRQQSAKLTSPESLLRQQSAKLSRQETVLLQYGKLIQQLRAQKLDSSQSESQNGHASDRLMSLAEMLTTRLDNGTTDMEPPLATQEHDKTVTSEYHDVVSRSDDDAGTLEAVVSQISQRVKEMAADIQALKTQTTQTNTDIQALETQTNTDIQALKTQTTQTNTDIQALKNSDTQQDHDIQDARSSTFVHWGSSRCSGASSQLVYSGIVGGSQYNDNGAATNYLCLTLSPVFGDDKDTNAYLYGGEYETQDSHQDKDPVCAVCRSTFSTTVMIPGTNVCTPGWHMQYSGFLMAGAYSQAAGTEFICVDSHLESRIGSDQDQDGELLYYTGTQCGSLPCGPYVNVKTVTCAVCGK